jgi:hypothetical protein
MGRPSKFREFAPADPFGRARRRGDVLEYHIGSTYHLAKASLSRLLQQFDNKVDFVILTSYHHTKPEKENIKSFQDFPAEYRALVGTKKVGAYELAGHWQEEGGEDQIERSWFFTKERAAVKAGGRAITGEQIQGELIKAMNPTPGSFDSQSATALPFHEAVASWERHLIEQAKTSYGNKSDAARRLRIHRRLLYEKLTQFGLL